jgi:hypothetical protein
MPKQLSLIIFMACSVSLYSQDRPPELISTAGNTYSSALYQLEWSIGETVSATSVQNNILLTAGFHQPYDRSFTGVESLGLSFNSRISIFPNPSTEKITVNILNEKALVDQWEIRLSNLEGKNLLLQQFQNNQIQLDLSTISTGVYFLNIFRNGEYTESHKIMKIH